jgi:hypothetical protein
VCPEHIHITDNAIIPLKERVVDRFYDPVTRLLRMLRTDSGPDVTTDSTGDFAGRVAIVTAQRAGLDAPPAIRLHERGAQVAVNVRDAGRC